MQRWETHIRIRHHYLGIKRRFLSHFYFLSYDFYAWYDLFHILQAACGYFFLSWTWEWKKAQLQSESTVQKYNTPTSCPKNEWFRTNPPTRCIWQQANRDTHNDKAQISGTDDILIKFWSFIVGKESKMQGWLPIDAPCDLTYSPHYAGHDPSLRGAGGMQTKKFLLPFHSIASWAHMILQCSFWHHKKSKLKRHDCDLIPISQATLSCCAQDDVRDCEVHDNRDVCIYNLPVCRIVCIGWRVGGLFSLCDIIEAIGVDKCDVLSCIPVAYHGYPYDVYARLLYLLARVNSTWHDKCKKFEESRETWRARPFHFIIDPVCYFACSYYNSFFLLPYQHMMDPSHSLPTSNNNFSQFIPKMREQLLSISPSSKTTTQPSHPSLPMQYA